MKLGTPKFNHENTNSKYEEKYVCSVLSSDKKGVKISTAV